MYDEPTSVLGSYVIYVTWLDQQFPSQGCIVFRYLKTHYPVWMYSFPYLVGQYLLYHVAKTINYVDPSEPGSLGGMNAFAKAHKIPQAQAKQQLEQLLSYTLHKPRRRRFPTLPTKVFSINEQFVMDLVDLQTLAKYNKGYKYLLTVIDVFSKYAWVEPLKSKSATALVEALERLWTRLGPRQPQKVQTDSGG